MKIALFADIHGKILLPFKLVDLYQKETGNKIDLILQCGDIGAFPSITNLDKATLRHALDDPDELGFMDDFVAKNPSIEKYLNDLNLNMICVRGNHEDHLYLDEIERASGKQNPLFPIDIYRRVWVCKSGMEQEFIKDDVILRFVGIGRIGDRKGRKSPEFIQDYERKVIQKLHHSKQTFDILITHDKDDSSQRGYGMPEIQALLNNVLFHFHFYGHTGEPFYQEIAVNGITQAIKIKELEFNRNGMLSEGCMVILEKKDNYTEMEMKIVEQSITNKITKHNWKY
jgi:predicted phosphodiesterase